MAEDEVKFQTIDSDHEESPLPSTGLKGDPGLDVGVGLQEVGLVSPRTPRGRAGSLATELPTTGLPPSRMCIKAALCASLNSVLLGYDIGIISAAAKLMQDDLGLSDVEVSVFVSCLNFMAIAGAIISARVSDRLGRTRTLAAASVLFLVGNLLMAISSALWLLVLGRAVTGLGVGAGLSIDPLYISEISPPAHRGKLVTFSETSINLGILLGYVLGFALSGLPLSLGWRVMLALGAVIPGVMLWLALRVMPETPRWLLAKDRAEEAEAVLSMLCNTEDEKRSTVLDIQTGLEQDKAAEAVGWSAICSPTPGVRLMLLVVIGVAVSQQTCGIEALMYYTPRILEDAGFATDAEQLGITMVMGMIKTGVILVAAALLDGYGRRKLLLWSLVGIIVAELIEALGFLLEVGGLNVLGLFLFVIAFSVGIGPICWLFAAEILPLPIRARGMMLACCANRATSAIIALVFPSVQDEVGGGPTFLIFAGVTGVSLWFVFAMVPETKGKTLEEMEEYFESLAAPAPFRAEQPRARSGSESEHGAL